MEKESYLLPWANRELYSHPDPEVGAKIGDHSPITRFVKTLMTLLASGAARPHLKHLTELFRLGVLPSVRRPKFCLPTFHLQTFSLLTLSLVPGRA
jgi:hypothetical protein